MVCFDQMHGAGGGEGVASCALIQTEHINIPGYGGYKATYAVAKRGAAHACNKISTKIKMVYLLKCMAKVVV